MRIWERRHLRIWLAVFALALFVGWLVAGSLTKGRVEAALSERLGLPVRVGRVALGFGSITLRRVQIADPNLPLKVEVQDFKVSGAWSYLLRYDRSTLSLSAHDAKIEYQLDHPRAQEFPQQWLRAMREKDLPATAQKATSPKPTKLPNFLLDEIDIRFVKEKNQVLLVDDLSATHERNTIYTRVKKITFGIPDHDQLSFEQILAELAPGAEEHFAIDSLVIEQGALQQRALASSDTATPQLTDQFREIMAVISKLRSHETPQAVEAPSYPLRDALLRLRRHLNPNASLRIATLKLSGVEHDGKITTYDIHDLALRRRLDDHLELSGTGETSAAGSLQWQFDIEPVQFQLQGRLDADKLSAELLVPLLREVPWHEPQNTRFSASLDLETDPSSAVRYRGSFEVENMAVASEKLAPQPIQGIAFQLAGQGSWLPQQSTLELKESQITLGAVHATLAGKIARHDGALAFELALQVPTTQCQNLIAVIPPDVLGDYKDFFMTGDWSGNVKLKLDTAQPREAELTATADDDCEFVKTPPGVELQRFREPFTLTIQETPEQSAELTTGPGSANWVPFAQISPYLVQAVLAHEDAGFYRHHGFAPWSIRDALARNIEEGRFVGGASTISMQLAKNLFLSREKTLSRKAKEVLLTWWLERNFSKEQILELYLNVIEYGTKLYGIKQAARHYFGREASELSPAEAAFFATILPSPKTYGGMYARNKISNSTAQRMQSLLEHMRNKERISEEALQYALAEIPLFTFWKDANAKPEPRALPAISTDTTIGANGAASDAPPFDPWEAMPPDAEN